MIPALLLLAAGGGLTATDGRAAAAPDSGDPKPSVILFISTVCPVSNDYHRRIEQLWKEYQGLTNFLVVYPNKTESLDQIREHARAMRFPFPVYRDDQNELADATGARVTPTAAIRTPDGRIAYLGPIDDAVNPARVKKQFLRNAIRATLRGRRAAAAGRPPYG